MNGFWAVAWADGGADPRGGAGQIIACGAGGLYGATTRAVQNLALSRTDHEPYAARGILVGSLSGRNPSDI